METKYEVWKPIAKIIDCFGVKLKITAISEDIINQLEPEVKAEMSKHMHRIDYENAIEYFKELKYKSDDNFYSNLKKSESIFSELLGIADKNRANAYEQRREYHQKSLNAFEARSKRIDLEQQMKPLQKKLRELQDECYKLYVIENKR